MNTHATKTATASALALMMTTAAASADVTPAEVWTDWQAYLTDFGFAVTATEAQNADGLSLTGIVLTQTLPDEGGEMTMSLPELTLKDNGDGTVYVAYPEEMPISIKATGKDALSLDFLYRTTDMDMNVSGDPSEMTYTYTAAAVGVTIDNLSTGDEAVDLGKIVFDMKDVDGRTVMTVDGGRIADQKVSAGAATYEFAFADPEEAGNSVNMTGSIESLDMAAKMTMPENTDMNNMAAALAAGLAMDAGYTFGPGASVFEFTDEEGVTKGTSSSSGGKLALRMDEGQLSYGGTSNDVRIEASVPNLPFPVEMGMKEAQFDLTMPLQKDDAPQDFGLTFVLGDLTVSDAIWALFDPEGKLPRDPAILALDLDGKASILADIFDPVAMAKAEESDAVPAELNALTVNRLQLRLAGAELTGQGDVTFDNDDMITYDGKPKPVGDVALKLTGANALLDKLVAMGLVPEDQVMGMRMMMGVFAVPGEGEDELTSKIEFTEEGGIVANGQRLK